MDDINVMEKVENEIKDDIIRFICSLQSRGARIILISSSSSFYNKIWIKNDFWKITNKQEVIVWKKYNYDE